MNFTHIKLQNFGIHKDFETDLYHTTEISGRNATGKSTIKTAIFWALNLKNENGKEISGVRPHDTNGNPSVADDEPTVVELTADNGLVFKRVYAMSYGRNKEPKGFATSYYICDIPKKAGEYSTAVMDFIKSEYCINAKAFLNLDTAKQRALLQETFSNRTLMEVVDAFPEFEPLRPLLLVGTPEQVKQSCNDKIKGSKTRGVKGLEQQISEIQTTINVREGDKVDMDFAELELSKNVLDMQLSENLEKQGTIAEEIDRKKTESNGILELQMELSEIERKANADNIKKRGSLYCEINDYGVEVKKKENLVSHYEDCNKSLEKSYADNEGLIKDLEERLVAVQGIKFDENELVCPTCGQNYTIEKQAQIRADFDADRVRKMTNLHKAISSKESALKDFKEQIEKNNTEISEAQKSIEFIQSVLEKLNAEYAAIPDSVDVSGMPEVIDIKEDIALREKSLSELEKLWIDEHAAKMEEFEIRGQLSDVEQKLSQAAKNAKLDDEIADLQKKQREVAQQIADQERILDLLKQFDRKKNELLTDDVNAYFEFCKVVLFEYFGNGEVKDVCNLTIDGESYARNLNHGSRILTEIDVCRSFQKKLGADVAIITEDTESIDADRIPTTDGQLILVRRTDDKDLRVKEI